eukprot:TRINITY_DN4552_c0_g1_i1.p2 TRINITY_DN4552_c0_g1~~TRINITY_DN4552_c0_g1_i1.p2  ORF type:complete len:181 (+),score=47.92 TRINITY_DN4552_c0_g1_i1:615-1157(+)
MRRDAASDPSLADKVHACEAEPGQLPYALLLSPDAYVRGVYVDNRNLRDLEATAALVHGAGGVAILAHWSTAKRQVPLPVLTSLLACGTLDGAETVYGVTPVTLQVEWAADRADVARCVRACCDGGRTVAAAGGGDVHKRSQLRDYAACAFVREQTPGMCERLVRQLGVCTAWSSLPQRV